MADATTTNMRRQYPRSKRLRLDAIPSPRFEDRLAEGMTNTDTRGTQLRKHTSFILREAPRGWVGVFWQNRPDFLLEAPPRMPGVPCRYRFDFSGDGLTRARANNNNASEALAGFLKSWQGWWGGGYFASQPERSEPANPSSASRAALETYGAALGRTHAIPTGGWRHRA